MRFNKYESVVILSPKITQKAKRTFLEQVSPYMKYMKIEELGIKKLAYTVLDHDEGDYVVFRYCGNSRQNKKLENFYKAKKGKELLKYIIVSRED